MQCGTLVYLYDEKGHSIGAIYAGNGPKDGLRGYTSMTVNIQRGATIYMYDERSRLISTFSAY